MCDGEGTPERSVGEVTLTRYLSSIVIIMIMTVATHGDRTDGILC